MKYKVLLGILAGSLFVGCTSNQPDLTDACEVSYQKCVAECKVSNATEPDWKLSACEVKCKTIYAGCKTKQKSIEGYEYVKDKVNNK